MPVAPVRRSLVSRSAADKVSSNALRLSCGKYMSPGLPQWSVKPISTCRPEQQTSQWVSDCTAIGRALSDMGYRPLCGRLPPATGGSGKTNYC
jgi:hypothetical protein